MEGLLLREFSWKDIKFDVHKHDSMQISKMLAGTEFDKYSRRMAVCCSDLSFAVGEDGLKLRQQFRTTRSGTQMPTIIFCRVRGCMICFWRRSLSWQARSLVAVPKLLADFPRHSFLFATFTVRNPKTQILRDTLTEMKRAFKRMSTPYSQAEKSKKFTGNKDWIASGFVRNTEVTVGNLPGHCHPHFHCLLAMPPEYFSKKYDYYMETEDWAQMWKKYMKCDYEPIVDIRAVRGDYLSVLPELFKYGAKGSELSSDKEFCMEYIRQMKGIHLTELGGIFSKYLKEEEPENFINIDEEEQLDTPPVDNVLYFRWRKESGFSDCGQELWAYQLEQAA
jgi:plasmid rolling circle replication initiator protein Rep